MILLILTSISLSVLSTAVMSYISMATPIGPWIAPTLVLLAMLIFKLFHQHNSAQSIALATCAGSIGGILATAFGFSFPTLYFLDPRLFNSWMSNPIYFGIVLAALALAAGWFGVWVANVIEHKLIVEDQLAFPIGQLVQKMIAAQNQVRKAYELLVGFLGTALFCVMQDGLGACGGFIPKSITLNAPMKFGYFRFPAVSLDLWPLLWAIGFVTGHVIAIPLAIGTLSKIVIVDPLNAAFFPDISGMEFMLAFCSGMIVMGAVLGFIESPKMLWKAAKDIRAKFGQSHRSSAMGSYAVEGLCMLVAVSMFLSYFEFSWFAQLYLVIFTFMCTHEISYQAGKIGLARLGMFATFVMVPGMVFFKWSALQAVLVATFVEVCGGVAADTLFGRKIAHMQAIKPSLIKKYQYIGLVISSVAVGVVFWLLIDHFTLGSPELFAQKAQNRQLLIDSHHFNYYVLALGLVFGFLLKKAKVNPSLVLGGLLMPLNISLGLIIGGFGALLTKNKEEWVPFWSGIFASNSVWMLLKTLF